MRYTVLTLTWLGLQMSSSCTVAHEYLGSIPAGGEQRAGAGGSVGLIITIQDASAGTIAVQPGSSAGVGGRAAMGYWTPAAGSAATANSGAGGFAAPAQGGRGN